MAPLKTLQQLKHMIESGDRSYLYLGDPMPKTFKTNRLPRSQFISTYSYFEYLWVIYQAKLNANEHSLISKLHNIFCALLRWNIVGILSIDR